MDYKVGPKGQVVIAKELREALGVEPGWVALQRLREDCVEIRFLPPEHRESLYGALKPHIRRTVPTTEALRRERERAWQGAVARRGR